MNITRFKAENVKRLLAVEITPEGNVIEIAGANGAGKSSVLDAIMYALAGKGTLPAEPLRKGARKGKAVLHLSADKAAGMPRMTVTRTFGKHGASAVTIVMADGVKATSPQKILDDLCGRIAFDPLEFTRQPPKQQMETLKLLVGIDFSKRDAERAIIYEERTAVNRDVKGMRSRLGAMETFTDAPAAEVSVSDLLEQLQKVQDVNQKNADCRSRVREAEQAHGLVVRDVKSRVNTVTELETDLDEAREALSEADRAADRSHKGLTALQQSAGELEDVDCDPIHSQISTAEETNRQVRANAAVTALCGEVKDVARKADILTGKIERIDEAIAGEMSDAEWPMPELSFDDDGVTLNDLPFEQASSAEQLRVSVAMGFAMNPTLRVLLIRDGSLLDADSLAAVARLAEEHDGQLWIERVGEGSECSVVIEDGMVKEPDTE